MSTLRATKNAIERHEAKYGRNIALRRAFNLTGGATPNIGILKNDKLVFGGTFTAAHKWLKGQKKVDVSQWEVAPVEELGKLCEKKHTAQCNKLARAMPKGLKLRVVMKKKAAAKKSASSSTKRGDLLKFFKKNVNEILPCMPERFFLSNFDHIEKLQEYNSPSYLREEELPSHIMLLKDEKNWRNSKGKRVTIPALKPIPFTPELYDSQFFEEMEEGNNKNINASRLATTKSHRRTPIIIIKTFVNNDPWKKKKDDFFDWLSSFRKNDMPIGYCMPWFYDDDDESDTDYVPELDEYDDDDDYTISGKPTPKSAKIVPYSPYQENLETYDEYVARDREERHKVAMYLMNKKGMKPFDHRDPSVQRKFQLAQAEELKKRQNNAMTKKKAAKKKRTKCKIG